MKIVDGKLHSEGKVLEVMPIIETPQGEMMMLPPVIYRVENWVLGYQDWHVQKMPVTYWSPATMYLMGSDSSSQHGLKFLVRVLEDSPQPESITYIGADQVKSIIAAIRGAQ